MKKIILTVAIVLSVAFCSEAAGNEGPMTRKKKIEDPKKVLTSFRKWIDANGRYYSRYITGNSSLPMLPDFIKLHENYLLKSNEQEVMSEDYFGLNKDVYETCRKFIKRANITAIQKCAEDLNISLDNVRSHILGTISRAFDLIRSFSEEQIRKEVNKTLEYIRPYSDELFIERIKFIPHLSRCLAGKTGPLTVTDYINICRNTVPLKREHDGTDVGPIKKRTKNAKKKKN